MKNRLPRIIYLILSLICAMSLFGCGSFTSDGEKVAEAERFEATEGNYLQESSLVDITEDDKYIRNNIHWDMMSVPTYVSYFDGYYFVVDCYNDQVIYTDDMSKKLGDWKVMTKDISRGHSIASDGLVYLIDDTEKNRILVIEKAGDDIEAEYIPTQEFTEIGNRPHYIIYDKPTDTFYAWSSQSGEMYLFRHEKDGTRMYLTEVRSIDELADIYVRSFTIIGDDIYFVSGIGSSCIIQADLKTFEVEKKYKVPDSMAGMVQLTKIQDYFYITVSTDATGSQDASSIIRCKNLKDLNKGKYEDVYSNFIGGGTPYCINEIDGTYYLTEHRLPGHSIWSFKVEDNEITNVIAVK